MTGPTIHVEGLSELGRQLRQLEDDGLTRALRDANKTLSAEVVRRALPNVPVGKTGRLKASVRALASQRGASVKAGGARVKYAAVLEFGAGPRKGKRGPHNIKARKFLGKAAESVGRDAGDAYMDEIDKVIRQAGLA